MAEQAGQLPGAEWVEQGVQDLSQGRSSIAALLVLIGAPRLHRLGIAIPSRKEWPDFPEHALYAHLQRENWRDAHSQYNALIRRLVSFERALENSAFTGDRVGDGTRLPA